MEKRLLSENDKKVIIQKLREKQVKTVCPMCGRNNFMHAGYFKQFLHTNPDEASTGGVEIPTIAIVCLNCGFVSQHAVGILGLLKDEKGGKNA